MKLCILVFSACIAALCFWSGFRMLALRAQAKNWERVKATVYIKQLAFRQGPSRNNKYVLDVSYRYDFKQKQYTGKNVDLVDLMNGKTYYTKESGQNKLSAIDDRPLIYVNPKNPAGSVIFLPGPGFYYFILLMGMLALLTGIINYFR